MKTIITGLQASTQTSYANNGKTTLVGRVNSRTINSVSVLGSSPSRFIDTFSIAGIGAQYSYYNPITGRLFICGPISAATTVLLFNFNENTGDATYVGRIVMNLPNVAATTYTARGFGVYESGGTATVLVSASGSVAINSGIFMANKVPIASFTPGGTQIFAAAGTDQVAMYQLQENLLNGVLNPLTTSQGVILPQFSSDPLVNTKLWQWNGALAATQLFNWDLSIAPSVAGVVSVGSATSSLTQYGNTFPAAFFNMPNNNAGFNATNGDPVNLTLAPPTGFNAWTPGTLQTTTNTYFVRDLQQQQNFTVSALPGSYTFQTTATTGIIFAGAQYTHNSQTFTIPNQTANGALIVVGQSSGAPLASGTLSVAANQWVFTATATTLGISEGATYTNNTQTFTFTRAFNSGATSFVLTGTGAPTASGTLTKATGIGPDTITFSASSSTVGPATVTFSNVVGLPTQYQFVTSPTLAAITAGLCFTNNTQSFCVAADAPINTTVLNTIGTGAPLSSGTLTLAANQYVFAGAAASLVPSAGGQILPGAVYTNNGQNFTFNTLYIPGRTAIVATGTGSPQISGVLTLVSGVGPAVLTYTGFTIPATPATVTFSSTSTFTATLGGIGPAIPATYAYILNGTTYTVTLPGGYNLGDTAVIGAALSGNPAPAIFQQAGALTLTSGLGPAVISFNAHSSGQWFFNLSATTGAAAIIPLSAVSTFEMRYAFGITYNQFQFKTATMATSPALGTVIQNQNTGYAKPISAPAAPSLQNQDCIFMGTTTGLYMGLISDLQTQAFNFTIPASTVTAGAVYMQNNQYFTVRTSITGGTVLSCTATGSPSATGTLSKVSGTGPDVITYSAFTISGNLWPSMNFSGVNMLGTGIDIVTPTALQTIYSGQGFPYDLDAFIINQSLSSYVAKPYQANNVIDFWGGQNNIFLETKTDPVNFAAFNAAGTISTRNGWFFISQPTQIGQRGVICHDISADGVYGYQGIISPVVDLPPGTDIKLINALQQLTATTGPINFWVRSGLTKLDAAFNSGTLPKGNPTASGVVSNGWTSLVNTADVGAFADGPYYQFCLTFQTTTRAARSPAQIVDLILGAQLPGEASEKWAPSVDNTTQSGDSPMYVSWRLQVPYAISVPRLYVKGYDDAGNLVASFDTLTNAASFSFSTNNGTSWSPLGTIPNTAFTTELRVLVATPPVTNRINWSLTE